MGRAIRGLALAALVWLGGCAQEHASSDQAQGDRVSTIPWNRPEKWEGQGMMGGFSGSH